MGFPLMQPPAARFCVRETIESEVLRPVNGATVSLGGRDSTDYYDLAAPTVTFAIRPPTPRGEPPSVPALLT